MNRLLITIMIGLGLYMMMSNVFDVPSYRSTKVILNLDDKKDKKKNNTALYKMAQNIAGAIPLSPQQIERTEIALSSIGDTTTAKMYYAMGVIKVSYLIIGAIFMAFFVPAVSIVLIMIGLYIFYNHLRKPEEFLKSWRISINQELPRFISIVEQELKNKRKVIEILQYYQEFASPEFSKELRVTIAGMNTGNAVKALNAMEARINSKEMSDIVRGLVRAENGDNPISYFNRISEDFQKLARTQLNTEAKKIPERLSKYNFLAMIMVILTIVMMMGIYTYEQAQIMM